MSSDWPGVAGMMYYIFFLFLTKEGMRCETGSGAGAPVGGMCNIPKIAVFPKEVLDLLSQFSNMISPTEATSGARNDHHSKATSSLIVFIRLSLTRLRREGSCLPT